MLFLFSVPVMELRALGMQGKCCTTQLNPISSPGCFKIDIIRDSKNNTGELINGKACRIKKRIVPIVHYKNIK
jgi:hypothetical protein